MPDAAEPADGDARTTRRHVNAEMRSAREHATDIRRLMGYPADPGECGHIMLGPLDGEFTGEEAWAALIAPVCTLVERSNGLSGGARVFADMSNCSCPFGFPPLKPVQQGQVLVTASSLRPLDTYTARPALLIDRKRIEEIGAANIPGLLRYLSQTAFYRGSGFRASAAQFAELRGLGAPYTLVLINGRRTFGTAADLASSAFDLSAIPVGAVERIEVLADADSVSHGTDAIGGIVNVVLSDRVEPVTTVRYGAFRGGGAQKHASISGGARGERSRISVFIDAERQDELLGRERDRWNNQDYTRFGGYDYRSRLASPPNIQSLDGQNLPGLVEPFAAAELNADTGMFEFLAGRQNRTSLRAFQAIVPQGSRATFVTKGSVRLGASVASLELLAIGRQNELQIFPSGVSGYTMGATHPDNPYGVPVRVDALLAGLPAQRYHVETVSKRAVVALEGPLGRWNYRAFVVGADEQAKVWLRNVTDPYAIAHALTAAEPADALSLYSTSRAVAIPERILVDGPIERYWASATQAQASLQGSPLQLPEGDLTCNFGVEYRREFMAFDRRLNDARRDVASSFAECRVPLIHAAMSVPAMEALELRFGVRRDHYSDIGRVTRQQFGLVWQMTDSIRWHASRSESFRPPSLAELHWRRVVFPTVMYDPRRGETALIDIKTGGNPQLRPTWGQSRSVGVSFQPSDAFRLSADYWQIQARGHITALAPTSLLAHEEVVLPEQVMRAPPTAEDMRVGQPGRLLGLDVSRANMGGVATQGLDLSVEASLDTWMGTFEPELSVSLTNKFLYSNLPISHAQMEDRVGVASEFGTIPRQRGIASLTYTSNDWRASIHARVISSYRDRSAVTGEPMQRRVPGGPVWDINVSKKIGSYLRFTLGAFNVTDKEPPFAHVDGSLGFDASQGDLAGREIYCSLSATFD
jgi:iron complex outermembrane receptor protein